MARGTVPAREDQTASDWRVFRPAIWLAMLGIAVTLLVSPPYIGALPIGAAIGVSLRILRRRR